MLLFIDFIVCIFLTFFSFFLFVMLRDETIKYFSNDFPKQNSTMEHDLMENSGYTHPEYLYMYSIYGHSSRVFIQTGLI